MDDGRQQKKSSAARKRGRKNNDDRTAMRSADKNASASMSLSSSAVVSVATKMRNDSSASALLAASGTSSRSRLLSKVMDQTYADLSPGKRLAKSYSFDYEDVSSRDAIACSKLPPSNADYDRGVEILANSDNAATFDDDHGRYIDNDHGCGSGEIHAHQMSYDELCDHSNRGE